MKRLLTLCMGVMLVLGAMAQNKRTDMEELIEMAAGNNGKAQYLLGMRYLNGEGVQSNPMMATLWFGNAYMNGYDKGMKKLRKMVTEPKADGTYNDYRYVLEAYVEGFVNNDGEKAAELFHTVYLQTRMPEYKLFSFFFQDPQKCSTDKEELDALKKVVMEYEPVSQTALAGGMLDMGKDTVRCLNLLHLAVDAGFMHAHNKLGYVYLLGSKNYFNTEKAVHHLLEAEKHHCLTYDNHQWLAFCYEKELGGLTRDEERIAAIRLAQEEWRDVFHEFLVYVQDEGWF